jgi:hypothetical protein
MLRRHERDLLCAVLRERVARVHESRFDHFLPVVGRRKAVLRRAGREAGRVVDGGQECDVETRVEAPAGVRCVAVVLGGICTSADAGVKCAHRGLPRGVIHSVKGSRAFGSTERACCFEKSRKRVAPV